MVFKNIISFGLLSFLLVNNEPVFCLVQRRESIPYILFVTNKLCFIYHENIEQELSKMTNQEKDILLQSNDPIILTNVEKYRHVLEVKNNSELDWSFPKGKSKRKEVGIEIAKREFEEETPFSIRQIKKISQKLYSYSVKGSDLKSYKYFFFPTELTSDILHFGLQEQDPKNINIKLPNLTNETSNVGFFGINQITEERFKKPLCDFIQEFYFENF
jgi:8-oxo-dGTP pyrophosphatase MutT (NUDIX family)